MSEPPSLISPEPQTRYCLYHFHKRPCSLSEHSTLGPFPSKRSSLSEKRTGPGAVTWPIHGQFCPRAHPFLGATDSTLTWTTAGFLKFPQQTPDFLSAAANTLSRPSCSTQHSLSDVKSSALLFWWVCDLRLFSFPKPQVVFLPYNPTCSLVCFSFSFPTDIWLERRRCSLSS